MFLMVTIGHYLTTHYPSHFGMFHIYYPTGVTEFGYAPPYGAVADRGAWSTSAQLKADVLLV